MGGVSYKASDRTLTFDPTYLSGTGKGKLSPADNAPWAALSVGRRGTWVHSNF